MSYYEKRIAELEARVAQLALHQRMKAIPVEAQLIDSIAELKAENDRLRKAGDKLVFALEAMDIIMDMDSDHPEVAEWNAAKEGKV